MGPLRVCPYEVGILAPHGSIMSLSIWASPYTSLTGPIWSCFLCPTWVLYWHAHMVLYVWDPYGSFMGLSIWETRIHSSPGPYGNAIWATHGSIIGVYICACLHWTHIGTIWPCPYGLACMGTNSFSSQTWPIWDLGPTWVNYGRAHMRVLICASPYTPHTWPIWACYLSLTWVLYGRSHMGNSYTSHKSHTWPIYNCYLGHTRVHYWRANLAQIPYGPSLG